MAPKCHIIAPQDLIFTTKKKVFTRFKILLNHHIIKTELTEFRSEDTARQIKVNIFSETIICG